MRGIEFAVSLVGDGNIGELAAQGKAILWISSYLPELLGVCDSLAVMHRGLLSEKRPGAAWTPEAIMHVATGGDATIAVA